jgi:hypothetical protein
VDNSEREVTVTLTFICHTQDEYQARMDQIRDWVETLKATIGPLEGIMTIQFED